MSFLFHHRSDHPIAPQDARQAASASSSSSLARLDALHIRRYGLTNVYEPSPSPAAAIVDIVFVHGLSGDPQKTWTSKNNHTFWPSQLLPQYGQLQNLVRVWTYGYDADPVSTEGASKDMIHDHSETLLGELLAKRAEDGTTERPIIFIAHSLGGLVVKRALIISHETSSDKTEHLRSISVSTIGIIFLGTPHKGSDLGAWGSYLEWLCHAVLPKRILDTQPQLVKALQNNSETLQNINNSFARSMGRLKLFYFYESKPTDFKGTKRFIVDKESAAPNAYGVERAGIPADHSTMCKFDDSGSPGFAVVADAVSRYASEAPQIAAARWLTEKESRRVSKVGEMLEKDPNALQSLDASKHGSLEGSWHGSAIELRNSSKQPGSSKSSPLLIDSGPRNPDPIYFVPPGFRENPHFVGREQILEELDQHLFDNRRATGTACVLLHGQPGVGKSSVARHYVVKNRDKFPGGVFWLNAYLLSELENEFWAIHQKLVARTSPDMLAGHGISPANFVEAVREWFQSRQEWLIVLDGVNVEDDSDTQVLQNFIPDSNNSSLIFVSRPRRLATMSNLPRPYAIKVPPLGRDEGIKLLFSELLIDRPRTAQVRNATKLVDKVGGLPLAISAIARRINDTGQMVERFHLKSFSNGLDLGDTFQQIIEDMTQHGHRQALNLMAILCFLGPHIPVEMIQLGLKALKPERVEVRSSEGNGQPDLNNSFAVLMRHALLERNEVDDNASSPADSRTSTLSDPDPIDMLKIPLVVSNFFAKRLNETRELPYWLGLAARLFVCSFQEADQRIKRSSEPPRLSDYRQYLTQGESLLKNLSEQRPRGQPLEAIRNGLQPVVDQIQREIQDRESKACHDSAEQHQLQKSVFDRSYSSSSSARSEEQLVPPSRRLDPPSLDPETENEFGIPLTRPQSESPKSIDGRHLLGEPPMENSSPPALFLPYYSEAPEVSLAMEKEDTSSTVRPSDRPNVSSPDRDNALLPRRRIWRQGTGLGSFRPVPALGDVDTQHALGSVQPRPLMPQRSGSAAFDSLSSLAQPRATRQITRGWNFWPVRPTGASPTTAQPTASYPGPPGSTAQITPSQAGFPGGSAAPDSPPGYQLLPVENTSQGSPSPPQSVLYSAGAYSSQAQSFSPPVATSPLRASISAQEIADLQYPAPTVVGPNPNPLLYSNVSVAPMSSSAQLPYPSAQPQPTTPPRPRSRSDVARAEQPVSIQSLLQGDLSQVPGPPAGYYSQPVSRDTSHQSHGSGTATEPPLQMPFSPPPEPAQPGSSSARIQYRDGSPLQRSPRLERAVPAVHRSAGSTPPQYQGSALAGAGAWAPGLGLGSGARSQSSGSGGTPPTATAAPMGRHGSGPGLLVQQGSGQGLGIAEFGEAPGLFVAAGPSDSSGTPLPLPADPERPERRVEEVGALPLAPGLSSASLHAMARGPSGEGGAKEASNPDEDRIRRD